MGRAGAFFAELKRRNVYKVAVAYIVAAWALAQGLAQVLPVFDVPNWAVRLLIVLLVLGFPLALAFAWVYEITPEGIKRTEDVDPAESIGHHTGRRIIALTVALAVVALAITIIRLPHAKEGADPAAPISGAASIVTKSVAVLPFVNLSDERENAFFADGIQDELLTDLSRIADLKVISRTSVAQYKNAAVRNLHDIAQQLRVAYLVEGSVQRATGRVRVNAQLIDGRSDSHLWAKTFDKPLDDVFAVQTEIAETIAQQLHAHISPEAKAAIEEKPTNDIVAYDLYLQTLQLWHNISTSKDWEGDTHKGINFLDRAVQRDPRFGLAYGLLVELNLNLYNWTDHSVARQGRAKAALDQAMRFAPDAVETYVARYWYYSFVDHDSVAALEMMRHAARLLPNDSDILTALSSAAARRADWAEAVRSSERAKELDPAGPNVPNHLTSLYLGLRDYARCDEVADDAIRRFPNAPGYFLLAKVKSAFDRGDIKLARERLAAIPTDWDPSAVRSGKAIRIEVADRHYEEAKRLIASFDRTKLIAAMASDFAFLEATVARAEGDAGKVSSTLLPLRDAKLKELAEHPNESGVFEELSRIDAYLGRKEEAIRDAERAVELRPISQDATAGPERITNLAAVCALTGEHDRAIRLLEQIAAIPFGPSCGELLMPQWDDLRNDPRFQKNVASVARTPSARLERVEAR